MPVLPQVVQATRARTYEAPLLMWELIKDFAGFLAKRKKYWLAPIIVVMLLLGALLVLASGSAIAPFIYTIF